MVAEPFSGGLELSASNIIAYCGVEEVGRKTASATTGKTKSRQRDKTSERDKMRFIQRTSGVIESEAVFTVDPYQRTLTLVSKLAKYFTIFPL
jgi:hypothetical protein